MNNNNNNLDKENEHVCSFPLTESTFAICVARKRALLEFEQYLENQSIREFLACVERNVKVFVQTVLDAISSTNISYVDEMDTLSVRVYVSKIDEFLQECKKTLVQYFETHFFKKFSWRLWSSCGCGCGTTTNNNNSKTLFFSTLFPLPSYSRLETSSGTQQEQEQEQESYNPSISLLANAHFFSLFGNVHKFLNNETVLSSERRRLYLELMSATQLYHDFPILVCKVLADFKLKNKDDELVGHVIFHMGRTFSAYIETLDHLRDDICAGVADVTGVILCEQDKNALYDVRKDMLLNFLQLSQQCQNQIMFWLFVDMYQRNIDRIESHYLLKQERKDLKKIINKHKYLPCEIPNIRRAHRIATLNIHSMVLVLYSIYHAKQNILFDSIYKRLNILSFLKPFIQTIVENIQFKCLETDNQFGTKCFDMEYYICLNTMGCASCDVVAALNVLPWCPRHVSCHDSLTFLDSWLRRIPEQITLGRQGMSDDISPSTFAEWITSEEMVLFPHITLWFLLKNIKPDHDVVSILFSVNLKNLESQSHIADCVMFVGKDDQSITFSETSIGMIESMKEPTANRQTTYFNMSARVYITKITSYYYHNNNTVVDLANKRQLVANGWQRLHQLWSECCLVNHISNVLSTSIFPDTSDSHCHHHIPTTTKCLPCLVLENILYRQTLVAIADQLVLTPPPPGFPNPSNFTVEEWVFQMGFFWEIPFK
jgi:hypothetical protein